MLLELHFKNLFQNQDVMQEACFSKALLVLNYIT